MKPKYLNRNGGFRVGNMFYETCNRDRIPECVKGIDLPEFSLGPEDHIDAQGNKFISIAQLFLDCGDITGYKFGIEVLGSYEHFVLFRDHKIIGKYIESWQSELRAKLDSFAIDSIKKLTKESGSQVQLSAAKYLANREYEEKSNVGRPSAKNKSRKSETHAKATAMDTVAEMERLGITH